jgi:hypothetical protein
MRNCPLGHKENIKKQSACPRRPGLDQAGDEAKSLYDFNDLE